MIAAISSDHARNSCSLSIFTSSLIIGLLGLGLAGATHLDIPNGIKGFGWVNGFFGKGSDFSGFKAFFNGLDF
jgi:hypothetical protein